jgi:hypothetical protein
MVLNDKKNARSEDLFTVIMKNTVFLDVKSHSLVEIYLSFEDMYCNVEETSRSYVKMWGITSF